MFYTNSGQTFGYNRQEVEKGKYVIRPEDPTRNGYVFKAWYITADSARDCADTTNDEFQFDFTKPVYQDVTLYAGWIERVYVVDE